MLRNVSDAFGISDPQRPQYERTAVAAKKAINGACESDATISITPSTTIRCYRGIADGGCSVVLEAATLSLPTREPLDPIYRSAHSRGLERVRKARTTLAMRTVEMERTRKAVRALMAEAKRLVELT
jgi:hypothetical protein